MFPHRFIGEFEIQPILQIFFQYSISKIFFSFLTFQWDFCISHPEPSCSTINKICDQKYIKFDTFHALYDFFLYTNKSRQNRFSSSSKLKQDYPVSSFPCLPGACGLNLSLETFHRPRRYSAAVNFPPLREQAPPFASSACEQHVQFSTTGLHKFTAGEPTHTSKHVDNVQVLYCRGQNLSASFCQ